LALNRHGRGVTKAIEKAGAPIMGEWPLSPIFFSNSNENDRVCAAPDKASGLTSADRAVVIQSS
jgi:hypothetical protein